MKVALLAHKLADQHFLALYTKISSLLKEKNIEVDDSYFQTSVEDDSKNLEITYKRNKKIIKSCDFLIAETTLYSSGIGYLIAESLNNRKPVLALYNETLGQKPSNIIRSSATSTLLSFKVYRDLSDLNNIFDEYIKKVKQKLDTKFILIIPPEIDRYLEWASADKRMHKAQLVREAVESMMEKDKDWKEHLNKSE